MPSFSLKRIPRTFGAFSTAASTSAHFWSGLCLTSPEIVSTESKELATIRSGLAWTAARRFAASEFGSLDWTTLTVAPHSSPPALAPSAIRLRNWLVPSGFVLT